MIVFRVISFKIILNEFTTPFNITKSGRFVFLSYFSRIESSRFCNIKKMSCNVLEFHNLLVKMFRLSTWFDNSFMDSFACMWEEMNCWKSVK